MSNNQSSNDNSGAIAALVIVVLGVGQAIKYLAPKVWNSFPSFVQTIWGDIGGFILLVAIWIGVMAATGMEPSCFVATAVYENGKHSDVMTLKKFRDRILLKSWMGRLFVKFYYGIGPYAAKAISKNLWAKQKVRSLLSQLVNWLKRKYPELQT